MNQNQVVIIFVEKREKAPRFKGVSALKRFMLKNSNQDTQEYAEYISS